VYALEHSCRRLDAQRAVAVGPARYAFERAVVAQHGDSRVAQGIEP
jgi:hypothetical protein